MLAAQLYRRIANRRTETDRCLFAIPCAEYVESVARDNGLTASVATANRRRRACQPGYSFEADEHGWWIRCIDGSTHEPELLSAAVLEEAVVIDYLVQHPPIDH